MLVKMTCFCTTRDLYGNSIKTSYRLGISIALLDQSLDLFVQLIVRYSLT